MMMMHPKCHVFLCLVKTAVLLFWSPLCIWSFHGPHYHYYFYNAPPFSYHHRDVVVSTIVSLPVGFYKTQKGGGCCSWSLKAQKENSLNSHHHQHGRPQQSRPPRQPRNQRSEHQFLSVNDVLDDYVKTRNHLKPYQVGLVWNKLGKAVQQLRSTKERRNFWSAHEANLRTLVVHTMQSVNDFNGQSTATVTHSLAKLMALTDSNLSRVQSLWNALLLCTAKHLKSDSLDAQSLSNLLWAYAKADKGQMHPRLLHALATNAMLRVEEFTPQGLVNVAWAYATMKYNVPELSDAVAKAGQQRIDDFKPQELANTAWAFATLKHEAPELFDAIANAAQQRIDDFNPQDFANTAWAYATLNHNAPLLFDAIAHSAQERIADFKPQELSNTAWAFATLKHKVPLLFDAISGTAQIRIKDFKPQELSNTAWAYATLNYEAPSLFDTIAHTAQERIADFNPQALSITVWAFATINYKAPSLLDAVAKSAKERIDDFSPQSLANTAWAYATLNQEAPSLFDAISKTAHMRIDNFKPQELSNTAWAFATLNDDAPSLFKTIARKAQEYIDHFNPQNLSNTAWAFATLNYDAPLLFDAIAKAAQERINGFNLQELSNTAWAFAVLNVDTNLLTDTDLPFTQTFLSTDPKSFNVEDLSQLHQFHLWCNEKNTSTYFSDELSCRCLDAFVLQEDTPSQLQNDVVASLSALQEVSQVQAEFRTKIGYSLDAAIVYRGNRIGLEVDGPSHFVGRGSQRTPNGKTVLKHRQLRTLEGWKLVSIPYWEWDAICDSSSGGPTHMESNKQAYLRNLLDRAMVY